MSKDKNKKIIENVYKTNLLSQTKEGIVALMEENEIAGQKVFYRYLNDKKVKFNFEDIDKYQSDGIIGNAIIECKLSENDGGGAKAAYKELFETIPNRLKNNGVKLKYYRIYVELKTFAVEVYDNHCRLIEKFDWYENPGNFQKFIDDDKNVVPYDLDDPEVDIVEVIQNLYKCFKFTKKIDAYKKLKEGIHGWFNPFDYEKNDINRLILNNDKMNEKYVQKIEGAFFTPSRYINISTQYVKKAIDDAYKSGYDDYVIIDRCAGVGNLQSQFDKEVYSHLILGTINKAEVLTANIRFGELANVYEIDALSKEGVQWYKDKIEEYKIKNNVKKLAIIFLENPPYAQLNSNKKGGVKSEFKKNEKQSWVHSQMPKGGEDLDEQFVFSAFEYYDPFAYIHFGPIKIWKTRHLINKKVDQAYLCDRKFFNASSSAIALIHWKNIDEDYDEIIFDNDFNEKFSVKKVYKSISELFNSDGEEGIIKIEARNFSFASPRLTASLNDDKNKKYGTKWIKKENILKVLPLFCAGRDRLAETGFLRNEKEKDYRYIDTLYKSGDGGIQYQNDKELLEDVLLWSVCTHYNDISTENEFWIWAEDKMPKRLKETKIWKLYKQLSIDTKLNGLKNIEKYKKDEYGKLWREHYLVPVIKKLKELLLEHYLKNIRPKFIKYELLK